jgi:hypothetical protein
MNAVSSAVDGFPDLSPSLLLVRALSTPSHHPEPHRGNLRALCKNNMRSISCFSAICSRITNRRARSGGFHHGPTEAEVRAALSGSDDWTIGTSPQSVVESALSTEHQSLGTISAQPVPQQEDFREVKIKDVKDYVFQFGWHFMAVHLDYVGQTRAVRFSFMTFPLEGRKFRPENYTTVSRRIEPSRDATPWGDYLVVFEHTAPDLSSLWNAMYDDKVLVDRFEGATAAFAGRTALT